MEQQINRFRRRLRANGTHDSICLSCFRTVANEEGDEDGLEDAERNHICDFDALRRYSYAGRPPGGVDVTTAMKDEESSGRPPNAAGRSHSSECPPNRK